MNDMNSGIGVGVRDFVAQPGQSLYLLTMVTGLAMAMLVGLQLALAAYARRRVGGGATAERALDARRAHRLLGRVLLVLVIAHPLFYLSAVTRRIGHFAPDKLYHAFTDGSYYGNSLLIGLAGVGSVCAFGAAALLRRRVPWWHGLVRVGVLLGGWHALRIGTHVRDGVAGGVLRVGLGLVLIDGAWRLARAGWRRSERGALSRRATRSPVAAPSAPGKDRAAGHVDMA